MNRRAYVSIQSAIHLPFEFCDFFFVGHLRHGKKE